VSII
jgi:hypothetical protein